MLRCYRARLPTLLCVSRPPSVDALARSLAATGLPHPLLVDVARDAIAAGDPSSAHGRAVELCRLLLRPVINATGVLLHTNLGRAPLAFAQAGHFTNVELDLRTGERGSRYEGIGRLIAKACGAERAMVVNNNAAAVLLVLAALARGRGVVVSRGESVEIGGGFRVPEVMAESGARLIDVGTTNRTRMSDYERATADGRNDVALALKVHPSNYKVTGFTEAVATRQLASLAVPVVVDLGSGLLDAACPWLDGPPPVWLRDEPAARQTLDDGAALITFSGDKLLGGPQAGIIAGRGDLVEACIRHPLARALRPGATVLLALQQTLLAYLRRDGRSIPFWAMASASVDELRTRAVKLGTGMVIDTMALPGAGSVPGTEIASAGVALAGDHRARLREAPTPIVARVEDGRTICDLRTVDPADDDALAAALAACLE